MCRLGVGTGVMRADSDFWRNADANLFACFSSPHCMCSYQAILADGSSVPESMMATLVNFIADEFHTWIIEELDSPPEGDAFTD